MSISLIGSVARFLKLKHTEEMSYKERYRAAGRHQDLSLTMEEEAAILTKQVKMQKVQPLGSIDCGIKYSNVAR